MSYITLKGPITSVALGTLVVKHAILGKLIFRLVEFQVQKLRTRQVNNDRLTYHTDETPAFHAAGTLNVDHTPLSGIP